MRKIVFINIVLFSIFKMTAQEIILQKNTDIENPKKGTYFKVSNNLKNKYQGIWAYESDGKKFKIKLFFTKDKVGEFFIDNIDGYYCYDNDDCDFNQLENVINGTGNLTSLVNRNKFIFMLYDSKNNKQINAVFELLNDGTASWILSEREGLRVVKPDKAREIDGFSIPTNIILTKEK